MLGDSFAKFISQFDQRLLSFGQGLTSLFLVGLAVSLAKTLIAQVCCAFGNVLQKRRLVKL